MRFFIEREDTKKQSSFLCDSVSLRLNLFFCECKVTKFSSANQTFYRLFSLFRPFWLTICIKSNGYTMKTLANVRFLYVSRKSTVLPLILLCSSVPNSMNLLFYNGHGAELHRVWFGKYTEEHPYIVNPKLMYGKKAAL